MKARLSTLFGWGSERGYLAGNVASNIKDIRRPKGKPDANGPWADEERDAVLAASRPIAARHSADDVHGAGAARRACSTENLYSRRRIATRRSKTGEPGPWPCPAPLAAVLAAAPPHSAITLCASSTGRPWTLRRI